MRQGRTNITRTALANREQGIIACGRSVDYISSHLIGGQLIFVAESDSVVGEIPRATRRLSKLIYFLPEVDLVNVRVDSRSGENKNLPAVQQQPVKYWQN